MYIDFLEVLAKLQLSEQLSSHCVMMAALIGSSIGGISSDEHISASSYAGRRYKPQRVRVDSECKWGWLPSLNDTKSPRIQFDFGQRKHIAKIESGEHVGPCFSKKSVDDNTWVELLESLSEDIFGKDHGLIPEFTFPPFVARFVRLPIKIGSFAHFGAWASW